MGLKPIKLGIINPGHFHAALVLKHFNKEVHPEILIYSEDHSELDYFLSIVQSYSKRKDQAAPWTFKVYKGKDYLERTIKDRLCQVAILAGKNNLKIKDAVKLVQAGIHVLADKPLVINQQGLDQLKKILPKKARIMDMMTERLPTATQIQKALVNDSAIFGLLKGGKSRPAVHLKSIHHLFKTVNGKPIFRPEWYFDIQIQGQGIIDVPVHLVDLVQWILLKKKKNKFKMQSAQKYETFIPIALLNRMTHSKISETLLSQCKDGFFHYLSNGTFSFLLKNTLIQIDVLWKLKQNKKGGDEYFSVFRGTRSEICVEKSSATDFKHELKLIPNDRSVQQLNKKVQHLLEARGFEKVKLEEKNNSIFLNIPLSLQTQHEDHFSQALKEFLKNPNAFQKPHFLSKYSILIAAKDYKK